MLKIDARDFNWEVLDGLQAIFRFAPVIAGGPTEVEITHVDEATQFSYYSGGSIDYVNEAFMFTPSKVLVCASTSSFAGIFNSHDNVSVRYYGLTRKKTGVG